MVSYLIWLDVYHYKVYRYREKYYLIGTLIPKSCVEALKQDLGSDAEKTEEHVSNL